jgi:hypothetical protein
VRETPATVWATQARVAHVIQVPAVPPTMDLAVPHIQDQAVLAMPAPVATSMTGLAARNIPDQAVSATTAPAVPPTMDLAVPHIQDQAVLAMPVLAAPATQVRVERVSAVHRYADSVPAPPVQQLKEYWSPSPRCRP